MRLLYATLLFCSFALASDSIAQDFVSTASRLKGSVVPVICVGQNLDGSAFLISVEGTGFFLSDDGDFITAGHVAQGLFAVGRIPSCPIPAIYVPISGWNEASSNLALRIPFINRCWWDSSDDVAICNLKENPFTMAAVTQKPAVAVLDATIKDNATPVAFTGFPLTFLQPITSEGIVGAYQGAEDSIGPKVLVIDKNVWPGASGSPVYTSDGKVIAMIVQRGLGDATGLAFARTSAFIQRFLTKNKQARHEEEEKQKAQPMPQ
jgi:S1-C subfamily serine protease